MPHHWPADTDFALWELDVLDRDCPHCGHIMYICDHRYRHVHTLEGPVELVCKLNHCPDPRCPGHTKTKSPEAEAAIAPPHWAIGWDVFCWIGHRRFARHWAIPQIRAELCDAYGIKLSDDAIGNYVRRYQTMLAARQEAPESLRRQYESVDEIILSIDGLGCDRRMMLTYFGCHLCITRPPETPIGRSLPRTDSIAPLCASSTVGSTPPPLQILSISSPSRRAVV